MTGPASHPQDVTCILQRLSAGHASAAAELLPLVYDELRSLAAAWFKRHANGQTLQPTALVHEAYIKLVGGDGADWKDRAHFFAVASKAIRQVLIDHARKRGSAKRGGDRERVAIDIAGATAQERRDLDIVALDEALSALAKLDARMCQIVELRLFGGLTGDAIAAALGVSRTTVDGDWQVARAWLRTQLADDDTP